MRFGCLSLLVVTLVAQQSQPTFRSGRELLRLDVSVVDASGQPVRDLVASDFVVKVDGKPRAVSFARFYGPEGDQPSPAAETDPPSFADNTRPTLGRIVILVVDLESMTPGYEQALLDTAGSLIDRLGPDDSAGLILIPGKGIELTRDHARVRQALEHARGLASASNRDHAITMHEAEAFFRDDRRVVSQVIERECQTPDRMCPADLDREARQILVEADQHIRNVVMTLTDLNARIARIEAPRTVVVLSAGLPYRQDSESYFRDLKRRAAESGVTTCVVQLYQPDTEASQRGKPGTASLPGADLAEGLSNVAGVTGGSIASGVGRAAGVFERIRREIVHTYQLGVESVPADADGKAHAIDVQVTRPGAVVRARSEFAVPKDQRPSRTAADVMALPPGLAEAPLAIGVYNTRGDQKTTIKLVVLVESVTGTRPTGAPSFALAITSSDGKSVFQTQGKMKAQNDRAEVTVAAQVAPGRYLLRGAIVDAEGGAGSVELPLAVGMRQAGDLQLSDLIVGTLADGFTPTSRIGPRSATALLELYAANPAQFDGVSVDLELRDGDRAVARGTTRIMQTPLAQRRVAQGTIPVQALEPGTYQISAVVKRRGEPFGRVTRTVVRQ